MTGVATAIAGGAVLGAYVTSQNAKSAANTESNAANSANATQIAINNQNQANEAPWNASGQTALSQMASGDIVPGMSQNGIPINGDRGYNPLASSDPGYQFRLNQGLNAVNASAAANGEAGGGATMKALSRYNQDYATNEYNNAYNQNYTRLAQIAGFGQAAVAGGVASNLTTGGQIGSNTMGAANAQAAGTIAQGNSINSMIGTGVNAYGSAQNTAAINGLTARLGPQLAPAATSPSSGVPSDPNAWAGSATY